MPRNLSINTYFQQRARRHKPSLRFNAADQAGWQAWKRELHPKVMQTLGEMPEKIALNPETIVEWHEDGLIKRKVVFDVEEGLAAEAYIFRPENATGPTPTILCCHGHGPFGKETTMGNQSSAAIRALIAEPKCYGLQMAKAGFVTAAIDWRGFGDRDDRNKPNYNAGMFGDRDPCNLNYLRATVLGTTMLALNVHDGRCLLDYLCDQPFVDPKRLGVMGQSQGGTMATWMSLCDQRIKASDIICYSDRFADFGMRDLNFCGSQITPGLYALCDVPDLQGLIAPRPLLVEIGTFDSCFRIESAMSCFSEVEKIYEAADVRDRLELDLFEGGHTWGANRSVPFFQRWL